MTAASRRRWAGHYEQLIWGALLLVMAVGWLNPPLPVLSAEFYDRNRQLQLLWLWLTVPLTGYIFYRLPPIWNHVRHWLYRPGLLLALMLVTLLPVISSWRIGLPETALRDWALQWLLVTTAAGLILARRLDGSHQSGMPVITALLALMPLLPLYVSGWMLFSLLESAGQHDWHQGFANIRMYDDALLPLLWLLWLRPGFWQGRRWLPVMIIMTVLYSLSWWLDGARAVLLATAAGLLTASVFAGRHWRTLLPVWAGFAGGFLLFSATRLIPDMASHAVLRADSSGRAELWLRSWMHWQQQPLWGVGGDQFGRLEPFVRSMHPHNLPLQWLGEWGLAGLCALLLAGWGLGRLLWHLWQHTSQPESGVRPNGMGHVPPVSSHSHTGQQALAAGALVAVTINACLSGMLVYPLSQLGVLALLCWIVWLAYPSANLSDQHISPVNALHRSSRGLLVLSVLWAAGILLVIHAGDVLTSNSSHDDQNAPRFWQYGRALHLTGA